MYPCTQHSNKSVQELMASCSQVSTDGIFILDQGCGKLIMECTMKGISVITPNLQMSPELILQTVISLNRSLIVTTEEIWNRIKMAFPASLHHVSILLF